MDQVEFRPARRGRKEKKKEKGKCRKSAGNPNCRRPATGLHRQGGGGEAKEPVLTVLQGGGKKEEKKGRRKRKEGDLLYRAFAKPGQIRGGRERGNTQKRKGGKGTKMSQPSRP